MPIYTIGDKKYNIPESEVQNFLKIASEEGQTPILQEEQLPDVVGKPQAAVLGAPAAENLKAPQFPTELQSVDTSSVLEKDKKNRIKANFRLGKFKQEEQKAYDNFIKTGTVDTSLLLEEEEEEEQYNSFESLVSKTALVVPKIISGLGSTENMIKAGVVSAVSAISGKTDEEEKRMFEIMRSLGGGVGMFPGARGPASPGVATEGIKDLVKEEETKQYTPEERGFANNIAQGNLGDAAFELTGMLIDSAPSIIASMSGPTAITAYASSIMGEKFEEEYEADPDKSTTSLIGNAVATGAIQGLSDYVGGKILKASGVLGNKGTAEGVTDFIEGGFKTFTKKYLKPSAQEFATEVVQDFAQKGADDIILGKEVDYIPSMYELIDTAVLTSVMTTGTTAILSPGTRAQKEYAENLLMDNESKNNANKVLKAIQDAQEKYIDYEKTSPALAQIEYDKYVDGVKEYQYIKENWLRGLYAMNSQQLKEYAQLKDLSIAGADRLNKETSDESKAEIEQSITNFEKSAKDLVQESVKQKIKESVEQKQKTTSKIEDLPFTIKALNADETQQNAENGFNEGLKKLNEDKAEIGLAAYESKLKALEQKRNNQLKSNGYIDIVDGETEIIVNVDNATKNRATTVADHEVLHALMQKVIKDQDQNMIILGNAVNQAITTATKTDAFKLVTYASKVDTYSKMFEDQKVVGIEKFNILSDLLNSKAISLDESALTKVGDGLRRFFQNYGMGVRFDAPQQVLNFIKDYNKAMQKGGALKGGLLEVAKGNIKGDLLKKKKEVEEKAELEEIFTQYSLDKKADEKFEFNIDTGEIEEDEGLATQKSTIESNFTVESPKYGTLGYKLTVNSTTAYFNGELEGKRLNVVFDSDEFKQKVKGDTGVGLEVLGSVYNRVAQVVKDNPDFTEIIFSGQGKRAKVYRLMARKIKQEFPIYDYTEKTYNDSQGIETASFKIFKKDDIVSDEEIKRIKGDDDYNITSLYSLETGDDIDFNWEETLEQEFGEKVKVYKNSFNVFSKKLNKELNYTTNMRVYDNSYKYDKGGFNYKKEYGDEKIESNEIVIDFDEANFRADIIGDSGVASKVIGTIASQVKNFVNTLPDGVSDKKLSSISFVSMVRQDSRIRLYKRLATILAERYNGVYKVTGNRFFINFTINKDGSDRPIDQIGPQYLTQNEIIKEISSKKDGDVIGPLYSLGDEDMMQFDDVSSGQLSPVERIQNEIDELYESEFDMDPDYFESKLASLEKQLEKAESSKSGKKILGVSVTDLSTQEGINEAKKVLLNKLSDNAITVENYDDQMILYKRAEKALVKETELEPPKEKKIQEPKKEKDLTVEERANLVIERLQDEYNNNEEKYNDGKFDNAIKEGTYLVRQTSILKQIKDLEENPEKVDSIAPTKKRKRKEPKGPTVAREDQQKIILEKSGIQQEKPVELTDEQLAEQVSKQQKIKKEKQRKIPYFYKLKSKKLKEDLKGLFLAAKFIKSIDDRNEKDLIKNVQSFSKAFETTAIFENEQQKIEAENIIQNALEKGFAFDNFFENDFFTDPDIKQKASTLNEERAKVGEELTNKLPEFSLNVNTLFHTEIDKNRKPDEPIPEEQINKLLELYKPFIIRKAKQSRYAQEQRVSTTPLTFDELKSNITNLVIQAARTYNPSEQKDLYNPETGKIIDIKKIEQSMEEEGLTYEKYKEKYKLENAIGNANAFINYSVNINKKGIYAGQSEGATTSLTQTDSSGGGTVEMDIVDDNAGLTDFEEEDLSRFGIESAKVSKGPVTLDRLIPLEIELEDNAGNTRPIRQITLDAVKSSLNEIVKLVDKKLGPNQVVPDFMKAFKSSTKTLLGPVYAEYIKNYDTEYDVSPEEGFLIENKDNILRTFNVSQMLNKIPFLRQVVQKATRIIKETPQGRKVGFTSPTIEKINDKIYNVEFTGKPVRTTLVGSGDTSGKLIFRRNKDYKNIISTEAFLNYYLKENEFGEKVIGTRERTSLADNISYLVASGILGNDLENEGPLFQKLQQFDKIKNNPEYIGIILSGVLDQIYDKDEQTYYSIEPEENYKQKEGDYKSTTTQTLVQIMNMSSNTKVLMANWNFFTSASKGKTNDEILNIFDNYLKSQLSSITSTSSNVTKQVIDEVREYIKNDNWDMKYFIENGPLTQDQRKLIEYQKTPEGKKIKEEKDKVAKKQKIEKQIGKFTEEVEKQLEEKGLTPQAAAEEIREIELERELSKIIEAKAKQKNKGEIPKGMESEASFEGIEVEAKLKAYKPNILEKIILPPDAEGLPGLLDRLIIGGNEGLEQRKFLEENFLDNYFKAINEWESEKIKAIKEVKKMQVEIAKKRTDKDGNPLKPIKLEEVNEETGYTNEQIIQVMLYMASVKDKKSNYIPGINTSTLEGRELFSKIKKQFFLNKNLTDFYNAITAYVGTKEDGTLNYPKPSKKWYSRSILVDFLAYTNEGLRKEKLSKWKADKDAVFNKSNMLKLEKMLGKNYVKSLKNVFARMESGRNVKPGSEDNSFLNWSNWVNASVSKIMFLNSRSGALQLLSAGNYINAEDNNLVNAMAAIGNFSQWKKDFQYILFSDFSESRRSGVKVDVATEDIVRETENYLAKIGSVGEFIKKIGFFPTVAGDSLAIALGGAAFYRNRVNKYLKEKPYKPSEKQTEADYIKKIEDKAWFDFTKHTRMNQQSSDPALVSKQQASTVGKLILAFKNTPMQYAAIRKRAWSDIVNNRGSVSSNMRKIAYYGIVQQAIFVALQQAVFYNDDEEDGTKWYLDVANGVVDSILSGWGFAGNAIGVTKNMITKSYASESRTDLVKEGIKIMPAFNDKARSLESISRLINNDTKMELISDAFSFADKTRAETEYFYQNPIYELGSEAMAFTFGTPTDRLYDKISNLSVLIKRETEYATMWLELDRYKRQQEYVNEVEHRFILKDVDSTERKAYKEYLKTGKINEDLLPKIPGSDNERNLSKEDLEKFDHFKSFLLLLGYPAWQIDAEEPEYIGPKKSSFKR